MLTVTSFVPVTPSVSTPSPPLSPREGRAALWRQHPDRNEIDPPSPRSSIYDAGGESPPRRLLADQSFSLRDRFQKPPLRRRRPGLFIAPPFAPESLSSNNSVGRPRSRGSVSLDGSP